jgi:hypothetical protein
MASTHGIDIPAQKAPCLRVPDFFRLKPVAAQFLVEGGIAPRRSGFLSDGSGIGE